MGTPMKPKAFPNGVLPLHHVTQYDYPTGITLRRELDAFRERLRQEHKVMSLRLAGDDDAPAEMSLRDSLSPSRLLPLARKDDGTLLHGWDVPPRPQPAKAWAVPGKIKMPTMPLPTTLSIGPRANSMHRHGIHRDAATAGAVSQRPRAFPPPATVVEAPTPPPLAAGAVAPAPAPAVFTAVQAQPRVRLEPLRHSASFGTVPLRPSTSLRQLMRVKACF